MANIMYNVAKKEILDGTLNMTSDTIKVMLFSTATVYTPNADNTVLDAGGANDPTDAEANVTNYTRGFGGAGRKTLASKAFNADNTNDRGEMDAADVTWTALGNGANQTISGGALIKEITNDAASRLIGYLDFTDFTTNGADFTLQWDTEGIIWLTSFPAALQLLPRVLRKAWSWFSELLNHDQVEKLKAVGVKPHIYRSVAPLSFSMKRAG